MIIVEGPDGAGKTNLVTHLAEELQLPVAPRRVSKQAVHLVEMRPWVDENLREGLRPTLFDRHPFISEFIYGPTMKGRLPEGFDDPDWLQERLARFNKLNPAIIWCLPPLEEVVNNIDGDPDNEAIAPHIETIYWLYYYRAMHHGLMYDYTGEMPWGKLTKQKIVLLVERWLHNKGLRSSGAG